MTLQEFLSWIISGGGAGIAAYWLMEQIGKYTDVKADLMRYLSLLAAGLLATGAYWLSTALGFEPQPETVQAWVESIFSAVAIAIGLSQAIHGALKLRK